MKSPCHPLPCGRWLIAFALTVAAIPALAESTASLPGANVESLLALARSQNPEFASLRYEADAAAERVYPAGALPDPTLRTELRDITNRGMDASPNLLPGRIGSTKYTLIQPVPFWGKRDLKQDVAEAQANQAKGSVSASWADLAARIKAAYAQYYVQIHAEALTREILDLVGSLEKITQTRYANGLAPQQDVIRIQIERTSMRSELVAIGNERHHAIIKLNTLLNRPTMASLADPEYLRPIPPATKLDHVALEERLRNRNPQLFVEEARVTAAARNRDLVLRNRYPDFNLGLSPIQTGSKVSEWELMIELNIPLQQESRRSQEREAQAMLSSAESRRESIKNQLLADLSENLATLDTARYTEHLNSTSFLPQAELSYKAAIAGYETGKVDFAALLEAQRQIRKARLDTLKAQGEMQIGLAEIERLLGEDL